MTDNLGLLRQYGNSESKKKFRPIEQTIKNSVIENSTAKAFKEKSKPEDWAQLWKDVPLDFKAAQNKKIITKSKTVYIDENLQRTYKKPKEQKEDDLDKVNKLSKELAIKLGHLPSVKEIRESDEFKQLNIKPNRINGITQSYKKKKGKKVEDIIDDYGNFKTIRKSKIINKKIIIYDEDLDLINDFENKKHTAITSHIYRGINKHKLKNKGVRNKNSRTNIFKRDGYECLSCGEKDIFKLTIDHIIPISKGGTNHVRNLQTLCDKCNGEKGDRIRDYRNLLKL